MSCSRSPAFLSMVQHLPEVLFHCTPTASNTCSLFLALLDSGKAKESSRHSCLSFPTAYLSQSLHGRVLAPQMWSTLRGHGKSPLFFLSLFPGKLRCFKRTAPGIVQVSNTSQEAKCQSFTAIWHKL